MCRKEAGLSASYDDHVKTEQVVFSTENYMETNFKEYDKCTLCPRNCGAKRNDGSTGFCGATSDLFVARAALHFWEEPCISGETGSGAVFFSGCSLHCVYCQNHEISHGNAGKKISVERLSEIFLELQSQNANNINLVTPTHYIPHIISAVDTARKKGLVLPIVYNTSGYEKPETIEMLKNTVDIFLPDFKYINPQTASLFSQAKDYPSVAKNALAKMFELTGAPVFDEKTGLMKRGIIVRLLVLPGNYRETIELLKYLYGTYGDDIYLSIMRQYTPLPETLPEGEAFKVLRRKLTTYEYESVVDEALRLGIKNAFTQEKGVESDSFIPPFTGKGV